MNPHEMTLEQCCDYLAEAMEWRNNAPDGLGWSRKPDGVPGRCIYMDRHPVPPTLEAIAGALPEGCRWREIHAYQGGRWFADAASTRYCVQHYKGDTEILARARIAVRAWEAEKKQ